MPQSKGLNPNTRSIITQMLARPIEAGVAKAEAILSDALGNTSGGQGVKYSALPNASSAPGQNPIKQFGGLQEMVGAEMVTEIRGRVGMFAKTEEEAKKARSLEHGSVHMEGRGYLQRTFSDPLNRQEIAKAAVEGGKRR